MKFLGQAQVGGEKKVSGFAGAELGSDDDDDYYYYDYYYYHHYYCQYY